MPHHHSRARSCVGAPLAPSPIAVALLLALAIVLAGCGGSSESSIASKSPAEILAVSRATAEAASSVHVVSTASLGRLSVASDLELASDGGRAKLSFLGLDYEVIRIGETLYLRGSPVFYERLFHGDRPRVPAGVWLQAPADTGRLARFAGLTELRNKLALALRGTARLTKGATTTIGGQPAIELKESAKLSTGSLAIASTGKPYPIQLVKRGRESGKTTFSAWDQPVSLTRPAGAIALSALERAGRRG